MRSPAEIGQQLHDLTRQLLDFRISRRRGLQAAGATIMGGTAAVMSGCNILSRPEISPATSLPQRSDLTPQSHPAIEQEQQPTDVELLMRNPRLKEWRQKVDGIVTIRDYGNSRRSGRIISKDGLLSRGLPDTTSRDTLKGETGLEWGSQPDWKFQITIETNEGIYEFIMIKESIHVPSRIEPRNPSQPLTLDNFVVIDLPEQRYFDSRFAAIRTPGDGVLIDTQPESETPIIVDWPKAA